MTPISERWNSTFYWVRVESAILLGAAFMSVVGCALWMLTIPRPQFSLTDMVLPSCLTWLVLSPLVSRATLWGAIAIGLASPFVGSLFVIMLRIGPVHDVEIIPHGLISEAISNSIRLLIPAFSYIAMTAWVTLPLALLRDW